MKRINRLTESDLTRIVRRVVKENENHWEEFGFEDEKSFIDDYVVADEYANDLYWDLSNEVENVLNSCIENMNLPQMISDYQNEFIQKYGKYVNMDADIYNDYIDSLLSMDVRYIDVGDLSSALTEKVFEWLEKNLKNN